MAWMGHLFNLDEANSILYSFFSLYALFCSEFPVFVRNTDASLPRYVWYLTQFGITSQLLQLLVPAPTQYRSILRLGIYCQEDIYWQLDICWSKYSLHPLWNPNVAMVIFISGPYLTVNLLQTEY